MDDSRTEVLLFDLGGVVFDIDLDRAFEHWAARSGVPAERLRRFRHADAWYERYERGEIETAEYFDALCDRLGIVLSHEELEAGWNAIFRGEVAGVVELLRALGERMPVYAFSNTNVAHQRFWERHYAAALEHFRAIFVSCELGLRKPEAEAFLRVSDVIGADPERILFFDDTRENVDGARAIGMSAVHVRDAADVRVNVAAFLE